MNARRPPSSPPEIPGFVHEGLLGSGGFADVFLYHQQHLDRQVAVKVLLTERLSRNSADAFNAEANIMAKLSSHPSIVTIHQSGVSGDGRPYLVMEYFPRPNLQARYKKGPLDVAEALDIGVRVSAAVETAHRSGILHRDIKPANILLSDYGHPALTDFGIAVAAGSIGESAGMSIPWSPPEVLSDASAGGVTADVWALGATVYTLLAGRSPFELPGHSNTSADLVQRIETMPLPRLARVDVPDLLHRVLERAMAKRASDRYASALDFARALQKVQAELKLAPTRIDVLDGRSERDVEQDDDGLTRIRSIVSIDPSAPQIVRGGRDASETTPAADITIGRTVPRGDVIGSVPRGGGAPPQFEAHDHTILRSPRPPQAEPAFEAPATAAIASEPAARRRPLRGVLVGVGAAVVLFGGVGTVWAVSAGSTSMPAPQDDPGDAPPSDPFAGMVPQVVIEATADGGNASFTWTNPDPQAGDYYNWGVQRLGHETEIETTTDLSVVVPAESAGTTCIEVTLVRSNGRSSEKPAVGCTP